MSCEGRASYVNLQGFSDPTSMALDRRSSGGTSFHYLCAIDCYKIYFNQELVVSSILAMSSKTESPGPNATTSQAAKPARSRRAEIPTEQGISGRAGSAGGVILEKEITKKAAVAGSSAAAPKKQSAPEQTITPRKQAERLATPSSANKDGPIASKPQSSAGPNRQRRRPRKLNRDVPTDDAPSASTTTATAATTATGTTAPTTELEALKSRVRGLEAKVEELYKSSDGRNRSPRRRGKGRKSSSAQSIPTLGTATGTVESEEEEEEADEELERAEEELESARRDLEIYQPRHGRPKSKRSASGDTDQVEEIPRDGTEELYEADGRHVTLTGSYRIPLPSTLDMKDVQTIQSGVSAAQNVARSFLEQRRANRAATTVPAAASASASARPTTAQVAAKSRAKTSRRMSGLEVTKETEGKSWGEWFGGYSMAISRAVKSIEAEAAIESQRGQTGTGGGAGGAGGGRRSGSGGKKAGGGGGV